MSDFLALVLIGVDGSRWDISGPNAGAQGVELLPKPKQFYDSPAITYWIKSRGAGQTYQGYSFKRRDPLFTLITASDVDAYEWADIDDQLRQTFGLYNDTFQLEATTARWGTRTLTMRLLETPGAYDSQPWEGKDPHLYQTASIAIAAACEQPHWKGETLTKSWTLPSGTSGSGTILHPGQSGDVPTFPRWSLTAPATWSIPDHSYGQEADFQRPPSADLARLYTTVHLESGEDVFVICDESQPPMVTHTGSLGPWMRSNGDTLIYPVKGYTPPAAVPISVTAATAGATATIEVDQLHSRPWGVSL